MHPAYLVPAASTCVALLVLASGPSAQAAGIRVDKVEVKVIPDPSLRYTFTLSLVALDDEALEIRGGLNSGDFFTIYDVERLVTGTERAPDDWRDLSDDNSFLGKNPAGTLPPFDSPTILNMTWEFFPNDVIRAEAGQTVLLGEFSFQAESLARQGSFLYGSQTTLPDGTKRADYDIIQVIPEPASLALVGLGLAAVMTAGATYRVRRQACPPM